MKRFIIVLGTFFLLGIAMTGAAFGAPARGDPGTGGRAAPANEARSGPALDTPTATPTCAPNWSKVPSPTLQLEDAQLYAVDAASSSDVWAVGVYFTETTGTKPDNTKPEGARPDRKQLLAPHRDHTRRSDRPEQYYMPLALIDHWNGSTWTVITNTNVGSDANVLASVDEVSQNDVWAVGYYLNDLGVAQTLVQHWNGTSWSQVPSANSSALTDNQLFSVQAVSATDAWAVGTYANDEGIFQTLIERWNGTNWSIVPSPNVGTGDNVLFDLAVVSANDIWAVGSNINAAFSGSRALSLHWNGTSWTVVPNPAVGSNSNNFNAVDAVSANDVWAVGFFSSIRGGVRALIEHWDGTAWNVVPAGHLDSNYNELYAIDAASANDIWAVGAYQSSSGYYGEALTEHWNGTAWTVVSTPNVPGSFQDALFGVVAVAANDAWAVGAYQAYSGVGRVVRALVERYSTACIPLGCTISFTDVHPDDYFYYPVLYLYCRGAVSGYGDNTFRPYNNTTRAQLAKILVLAEGWDLVFPFEQHFIDVFPWDPFYQYIETAYSHGIISGYSCSAPAVTPTATFFPAPTGTPARSGPLATGTPGIACREFRPGSNITRGQLCKVIVLAEGWSTYEPPEPTFRDVLVDHPFYRYVETAYNHGIISGYEDGTFRPGNNATRGQIAKIIFRAVTQR